MDKRLILAVAGSGKTSLIIDGLNPSERTLLVTYTVDNYQALRNKVFLKFGCIPDNVHIYTYFQFLYQFCVRPLLGHSLKIKGIDWKSSPPRISSKTNRAHYLTQGNRLFHNRIAKLLIEKKAVEDVCQRLEKYFDTVCVDEVQDFAANDFNLIIAICQAQLKILFVGDYYQHTYDTSRDGNTRANLYKDYDRYRREFENVGLTVDRETLVKSYRCDPELCKFVEENLGIEIRSHRDDHRKLTLVDDAETADRLFRDHGIVKLFYESYTKYQCLSNNWGRSKGRDDYHDVCIVLNRTTFRLLKSNELRKLNPTTRNKLYVALTRAKGSVYLAPHTYFDPFKLP